MKCSEQKGRGSPGVLGHVDGLDGAEKRDSETDITDVDDADRKVRYKKYWFKLPNWYSFLKGRCNYFIVVGRF